MARNRPRLEWNGDNIVKQLAEAARQGIDDFTDATDTDASSDHWWKERTAPRGLTGQIITRPAVFKDGRVVGSVGVTYSGREGVFSGFYGWFLELRLPWFRPAADRNAMTLPDRVKRRFRT